MDVLIERACGLDVHKKSITACIVTPEGKEIKTFRTHTIYLIELMDWIKEHRCTHCGHGEHRRVLEANRELARSGRHSIPRRQRTTHEGCPWSENGCKGF